MLLRMWIFPTVGDHQTTNYLLVVLFRDVDSDIDTSRWGSGLNVEAAAPPPPPICLGLVALDVAVCGYFTNGSGSVLFQQDCK